MLKISEYIHSTLDIDSALRELIVDYELNEAQREMYFNIIYGIVCCDNKYTPNEDKVLTSLLKKIRYNSNEISEIRKRIANKIGASWKFWVK
jgi:hypothetical protein